MDRSPFSYGLITPMTILRDQRALANRVAGWNCAAGGCSTNLWKRYPDTYIDKSWDYRPSPLVKSPNYEIRDNDDKFVVAVDMPGVSPDDISISFNDDSKLLSIRGKREYRNDRGSYVSSFSRSFSLDSSVKDDEITANLDNGVLIVSAPKDKKHLENKVRTIPVSTPPEIGNGKHHEDEKSSESNGGKHTEHESNDADTGKVNTKSHDEPHMTADTETKPEAKIKETDEEAPIESDILDLDSNDDF